MKKQKLNTSILTARNIIEKLKTLVIFYFFIIIILTAINLFADSDLISKTAITTYNFINNKYIELAIFFVLSVIYGVILWLTLDNSKNLLDNILNIGIFSKETISSFDKCLKFLIILFMVKLTFLSIDIYLIIIIAIINICKNIFVYGANLEKEISEVI